MARSDVYGMSFSPIDPQETLEDLPRLLERLISGGRAGVRKLPRPSIRGALPLGQEIFQAFLGTPEEAAPAGGISGILAPEQAVPGVEPVPDPVIPGDIEGPAVGPAPEYGNEPSTDDDYAPPADYSEPSALLPEGIESEPMFGEPEGSDYTSDFPEAEMPGAPSEAQQDFFGNPPEGFSPSQMDYGDTNRMDMGEPADYSDPDYGFGGEMEGPVSGGPGESAGADGGGAAEFDWDRFMNELWG